MYSKANELTSVVCETLSDILGVQIDPKTLFAIREKNVARETATARQLVHYSMHCLKGYSVTFVARATETTRRCVFSNVRKAKGYIQTDKKYKELFLAVKEKIT